MSAILNVRKSLSMTYLDISYQYVTFFFLPNGRRRLLEYDKIICVTFIMNSARKMFNLIYVLLCIKDCTSLVFNMRGWRQLWKWQWHQCYIVPKFLAPMCHFAVEFCFCQMPTCPICLSRSHAIC